MTREPLDRLEPRISPRKMSALTSTPLTRTPDLRCVRVKLLPRHRREMEKGLIQTGLSCSRWLCFHPLPSYLWDAHRRLKNLLFMKLKDKQTESRIYSPSPIVKETIQLQKPRPEISCITEALRWTATSEREIDENMRLGVCDQAGLHCSKLSSRLP